jgi:signal transduction histidine kinase
VVDGHLLVEVQDDGVGFDASAETKGFGLAGMRERIFLAGGRINAESGAAGTIIRAWLPVLVGSRSPARPQRLAS